MNRDFFIPCVTPKQARLIIRAATMSKSFVSPGLEALAEKDRLSEGYNHLSDLEVDICQFIEDYSHRCVVPTDLHKESALRAIAAMIPEDEKVLFITNDPILWVRKTGERINNAERGGRLIHLPLNKANPNEMLKYRDRYVVAHISLDDIQYQWLGKLFKKIIFYCNHEAQMKLRFAIEGTQPNVYRHAAYILYPAIVSSLADDKRLYTKSLAAYPLIGCYPDTAILKKNFLEGKVIEEEAF